MTHDGVLAASLLLGACFLVGWYVTLRLTMAALVRPWIPALTTSAVSSGGIALGATFGLLLGLSRLGVLPEFPLPVNIGLLLLTVFIPSVGNLAKLLLLQTIDKPRRETP